ncbi:hypothetical protein [Thalassoglobus polymorphus]|uniref:hypothetical protein n=1 Tax=Thalassoglobus polymorphus TaxID=2527994 RepID=UPI001E48CCB7|nr:hypothetical protein [Thalassoglobus polymorphus]
MKWTFLASRMLLMAPHRYIELNTYAKGRNGKLRYKFWQTVSHSDRVVRLDCVARPGCSGAKEWAWRARGRDSIIDKLSNKMRVHD